MLKDRKNKAVVSVINDFKFSFMEKINVYDVPFGIRFIKFNILNTCVDLYLCNFLKLDIHKIKQHKNDEFMCKVKTYSLSKYGFDTCENIVKL